MEDVRATDLDDSESGDAKPVHEITVFLPHEVPLVKQPYALGRRTIHEHGVSGRCPDVLVRLAALRERAILPRVHRLTDEVEAAAGILNEVGRRRVKHERRGERD